jgi:pilus assembly protein CpaE
MNAIKVILVGDHEFLIKASCKVLGREGITIAPSQQFALSQAKAKLTSETPDLVLLILPPDPELGLASLIEVRTAVQAKIFAIGPVSNTKLVLRALRHGADDYIDQDELDTELREAMVSIRNQGVGGPKTQSGRVIAVLASSGGSGSSTLATNIGICLAKEHQSTALFDLRLDSGDLASLLDVQPTYTIADLCQNVARLDKVMLEHSLTRHESGLKLLASPTHFSDALYVNSEGVQRLLSLARTSFPFVVIDIDRSFHEEQVIPLQQADIILIVVRPDFVSLRNARRSLDQLERFGIESSRVRLVINRKGMPREVPVSKVEEVLKIKLFHAIPDDPWSMNRATNTGLPVVLDAPSSKASKCIKRLASELSVA